MTSAPKSDRIVAAPGPAMKLAKSTTFSPEKMLSSAIGLSYRARIRDFAARRCANPSAALEPRYAFFEEGRCPFLLVFRRRTKAEIGSLKRQALALTRLHPPIDGLERVCHCDWGIAGDLLQDGFGTFNQRAGLNDFVDEPDTVSLLCVDHFSRKDELQGSTLADEARQALRSTAAWNESQCHFWLAEFCVLRRHSHCARHCCFAAATQREAVDRSDHGLAEVFDEIENRLAETAGFFCFDRSDVREFTDVCTGDERFIARSRENYAAHGDIVACVLEDGSEVLPCWRIQR